MVLQNLWFIPDVLAPEDLWALICDDTLPKVASHSVKWALGTFLSEITRVRPSDDVIVSSTSYVLDCPPPLSPSPSPKILRCANVAGVSLGCNQNAHLQACSARPALGRLMGREAATSGAPALDL